MTDPVVAAVPAAAVAAVPAAVVAPWYQGVDADLTAHLVNKGWDKLTPTEAAIQAAASHRSAEKMAGGPVDKLLRIPEVGDVNGWKATWQRLGAPADPKEYDFTGVKFADGTELEPSFIEHMRGLAAANNLPKGVAAEIAKGFVKYLGDANAAETAERSAALALEQGKLKTNWGANADANMFVAKKAAAALGVTAEEIAALETTIGYARTMDLFRNVGSKIGEDRFVSSVSPTAGVMTAEQASSRLVELKNDSNWASRLMAGDTAALREFQALTTLAVGDDTAESRGRK